LSRPRIVACRAFEPLSQARPKPSLTEVGTTRACYSSEWLHTVAPFEAYGEQKLTESAEVMQTMNRFLLMCSVAALMVLLVGCASSDPSTSQAPPETPEEKATGAAVGQDGAGGEGGGGQSGAGEGGQSGGESSEGSSETGQGEEGGSGAREGDAASAGAEGGGAAGDTGQQSGAQRPAGSPATGNEAAAALDQQLDGALQEFDRRMREEMERLAEETADAERAGSSPSGGGTGSGHGSSGGAAGESAPSGETDSGGSSGGNAQEGDDSEGSVGGSGPGGEGSSRAPADVGDGADDDIVARQLREAAMAEEDPELREKLWDEYRRYKASLSGSSEDGK